MSTMSVLSSRRIAAGILLIAALSIAVPTASAQFDGSSISVSSDEAKGLAVPDGGYAHFNITVSYSCGDVSGTIDITATPDVSGATATVSPSSFEAEAPPSCTLGSPANTVRATVYVNATKDVLAWDQAELGIVELNVTASGETLVGDPASDSLIQGVNVGPYVDVAFSANVTEFEADAGAVVPVEIKVQSNSNIEVMVMPDLQRPPAPPTWGRPSILPENIASPLLDGEDGSSAIEFDLTIPANTPTGTYTLNFTAWAHAVGSPMSVENPPSSNPVVIPLTFTVQGSAPTGDDTEEGPGVGGLLAATVFAALAFVAWRRRG